MTKHFFKERYEQVNNFEEYLYQNGYKIIKIFLHVSKDEQARQLLERIDIPEKNWKFRADDIRVREKFDEYVDYCYIIYFLLKFSTRS